MNQKNIVNLPEPQFPMMTRVVSKRVFAEQPGELVWALAQPHPLDPDMRVIRIFEGPSGVEIYSLTKDNKGVRNRLPAHTVLFTEEVMPIDVLVEELMASEADDDEDVEDEGDHGAESPEAQANIGAVNGTSVS